MLGKHSHREGRDSGADFLEEGASSKRQSKWSSQDGEAGHVRRVATGLQRRAACGQQQGRQSGRGPEAGEGTPLPPDPQNSCISFLAQSL